MGYPIQNGAPKITYQGRTFGIGLFENSNIAGSFVMCAVLELQTDGTWNSLPTFVLNIQTENYLGLIQSKGGIANFISWLKVEINKLLATIFTTSSPVPTPSGEPTDYASALSMSKAYINAATLSIVNGQIVLN